MPDTIKEAIDPERENWEFLTEEVGKIKIILQLYRKLIDIIEIKNNRYNQVILLILDSFTKTISTDIAMCFDKPKSSFSLIDFKNLSQEEKNEIENIKKISSNFINFRHERVAHNPKTPRYFTQKNNFDHLNIVGVNEAENIIRRIEKLLEYIGKNKDYNTIWASWPDIESSCQCLIEDLRKK